MKRYFINQEKDFNKFWQVEITGKKQLLNWGKIGTAGRESIKEFANEDECLKETEKLIAQKIKKGYTEVDEDVAIPEKVEITVEDTPEARFWDAINKSNKKGNKNWKTYDIEEHLEKLTKLLSKWTKDQLIEFETVLQSSLKQLFRASVAEFQMILENSFKKSGNKIVFDDGLSDDGFIYFRCWLILKGKDFFDEIIEDINAFNNGKYSFDIADTWAEGLLYISDEAYSVKNENENESEIRDAVFEMYPEFDYDSPTRTFDREPVNGNELQKMYPEMVDVIVSLR